MPELPSGITISKIKNASSATRSGATPEQTTVRFFFAGPADKMVGEGDNCPSHFQLVAELKFLYSEKATKI